MDTFAEAQDKLILQTNEAKSMPVESEVSFASTATCGLKLLLYRQPWHHYFPAGIRVCSLQSTGPAALLGPQSPELTALELKQLPSNRLATVDQKFKPGLPCASLQIH